MSSARSFAVGRNDQMRSPVGHWLGGEHGIALAKVAMALLGDQAAVERSLERVAREAAKQPLPEIEDDGARRAWLFGLVRAACAAQLSKLPVRAPAKHGEVDAGATTQPEDVAAVALARRALARLRPTEREAVVLHLVGGLDVRGVARACGVAEDVARARLARGVSQLMEEEGR